MSSTAFRVLYLGAIKPAQAAVRKHFTDLEEKSCGTKADFESLLVRGGGKGVHFVIAGPEFSSLTALEIAQGLRMAMQDVPVYFVTDYGEGYDRASLVKNGFHDSFLLPDDALRFDKMLAIAAQEAEHRVYSPVRLVDIQPGTKLDFEISIFLPANNKYILYSNQGDKLEAARLQRLKTFNQTSVYVPAAQIAAFHSYSALRMHELTVSTGASGDAERRERLRRSVHELLQGLMIGLYSKHVSQGKKVVDHSRQIVRQFVQLMGPADWYKRLFSETSQRIEGYNHGGNVAAYATLFATLIRELRPCRVEELSAAGLFHDLGIASLPLSIQEKKTELMSPDELRLYQHHPQFTLDLLKARNHVVSEPVVRAIAQHHERWNGSGYPEKKHGNQISIEAQILGLADTFDYLTRAVGTVSPMSPDQALRQMTREANMDPVLLNELRLMFEREQKATG